MSRATRILIACLSITLCLQVGPARAQQDETAMFSTSVSPDALIVLDLSGSMDWNPAGGTNTWGNSTCSGTFYGDDHTVGYTTKCSKLDIAKRAIFNILDDNNDNIINSSDETSLGVRIGYMRYYDGNDQSGSYTSGANKLSKAINTKYSNIFCNNNTSCTVSGSCSSSCSSSTACVNSECANGGTPLAASLNEANLYLTDHKAADTAAGCRQKFVILITDGVDTYGCSGNGTETQSDMYKRRRETVAKAKALADAGYRLFVIGFGAAMPDYMEKTLNWMAYFGGTDNPLTANGGDTSAYNPAAVTSCGTSPTSGTCNGTSANCFATSNDPGNLPLSGYAFLAADADQLNEQLKAAINIVREATYSFSQSSIQSTRTKDENFIYEGSFQPVTGDPFWLGHLKRYGVNDDGTVGTSPDWDAGTVLMNTSPAGRNIKTYKGGSLVSFTTANITMEDLGVATNSTRDQVVGYFRGESAYNPDNWKLGDLFRSNPITVGSPSAYFEDFRDLSTPSAFSQHRTNHLRATNPYSGRIVVVGANDGQVHAFKTSDGSEAWSFIPPNLLSRLKEIFHTAEPTSLTHQNYVDGPVTVADAWIPSTPSDGTSKLASDWHTLLLFGEGRGAGTNLWSSSSSCDSGFSPSYTSSYPYYCGYYCLDLNSSLSPVFKWRLGFSSSQAPYMGAPLSRMMVGRVLVGGNEKWVGFIGGGVYASGAANSGKGFFVIDLVNGNILWSYTNSDNAAMNYPMPATPAIVDTDNDGLIDTVYLGDLGSNMWRFKFCRAVDGSSCTTTSWSGSRLFQADSSSGNRPIYTSAVVAKGQDRQLWISWGTGDKMDPTNSSVQEKIFALTDGDRTTTRTISELQNITAAGTSFNDSSKYGYYINLAAQGEKVLADPTIFGGVLYVTSFIPASSSNPCDRGGSAMLTMLNLITGAGAIPIANTPRSMSIGTGIASAPVISLRPGTAAAASAAAIAAATAAGASASAAAAAGAAAYSAVSGGGTPSAAAAAASAAAIAAGASASAAAAAGIAARDAALGGTASDLYVTTSGGAGVSAQTKRVDINPPGLTNRTNMLFWKDKRVE